MSQSAEPQSASPSPTKKQKKRKSLLLLLGLVFIILAIGYGAYWFLVLSHYEETDDAYVAGNQVQVMPQVTGNVTKVWYDDTDLVKQGTILVSLDKSDARQAFEKAQTSLASTVRQTKQLMINSQQYQANIRLKKTALQQAQADLARRTPLAKSELIGREELQHARDAVTSAQSDLEVAQQQFNANQALILDTPLAQQPAVQQSAAALRDAWLALQRTDIKAPIDGYVSRRNVQVGSQVSTNSQLMVIVPRNQLWIDANFKETQLSTVRIGQSATVVSDLYGDNVIFHGKVAGLDMGTGSAFSLLPAQNATGNWIKVVQRLPVRIVLDQKELAEHPLRIGLSTLVSVDTSDKNGPILANVSRQTPAYQTDALQVQLEQIDKMINQIIAANAG